MTTQYEYARKLDCMSLVELQRVFREYCDVVQHEMAHEGKYKGYEVSMCAFYKWHKGTPLITIEQWFYDHGVKAARNCGHSGTRIAE